MEREENNALQQAGFKLSISWVIGMSSTTVPTTIVFYTMFSLNVIKVYLDIGRWAHQSLQSTDSQLPARLRILVGSTSSGSDENFEAGKGELRVELAWPNFSLPCPQAAWLSIFQDKSALQYLYKSCQHRDSNLRPFDSCCS